jgi:hypothetical protein
MKTLMMTLSLALGLSFAVTACGGGGGNACDDLAKKICEGKDDAYCKKARTWLDKEMVGPDDEKLSSDESNMACKMIAESKEVVTAYKNQAAKELGD